MDSTEQQRRTIWICVFLSAITLAVFWPVTHAEFLRYDDPIYVTARVQKGLDWSGINWAFTNIEAGFWHPLTWLSLMLDAEIYGSQASGYHTTSVLLHVANVLLVFLVLRGMTSNRWKPRIPQGGTNEHESYRRQQREQRGEDSKLQIPSSKEAEKTLTAEYAESAERAGEGQNHGGTESCGPAKSTGGNKGTQIQGRVGGDTTWQCAFVAALFALHPLHVESVAWIAERKDVLSTLFFLLTLFAYERYVSSGEGPGRSKKSESRMPKSEGNPNVGNPKEPTIGARHSTLWYGLALFLFACGLMSKTLVVSLPAVLLLLDYWPLGRLKLNAENWKLNTSLVWEKLPFVALAVASVVVTAVSFSSVHPAQYRILNALTAYVRYLGKTVWPGDLAVFYPYPKAFPLWQVLGAGVLLLGITVLAIRLRRKPYLAVGWFWYLGTLVPMIGLIQIGDHSMADRYSYVPLIGIFVAIVWVAADVAACWPVTKLWLLLAGGASVAACAAATCTQLTYWQNTRTLFEHTLAVTRDNAIAQNDFGVCLMDDGDVEAAAPHFQEAVRIQPDYAAALVNVGICRAKQGHLPEAIEILERALRIHATAMSQYILACLFLQADKLGDAESHFELALRLDPKYIEARYNLGLLQHQLHKNEEAEEAFTTVLRLKPDLAAAHLKLGSVLLEEKKWDEAIAHLGTGLVAIPGDIEARKDLGVALYSRGKIPEAVAELETALSVSPDARTHYYLALALHGGGQFDAALVHYREAVRLDSKTPDYLNDLAWLLATCPKSEVRDGDEAVRMAEQACRLSGGKEARYWGTLDAAYAEAGRFDEAVTTAMKTRDLAIAAGEKDIAKAAEERVKLYRLHKPYRP